jgi:Ca-activated chloride channel family protein
MYAYVDDLQEARKVLVEQMGGTLFTVAKDVKLQVEFNPAQASAFRLLGYENRVLAHQDFADDSKDAGEMGAGHSVVVLYEVVPAGGRVPDLASATELRYQRPGEPSAAAASGELLTVKARWKEPEGAASQVFELPVRDGAANYSWASGDFKLAAAVASFGMLLRGSEHRGTATFDTALELAQEAAAAGDPEGYRRELVELVLRAKELSAPAGPRTRR